MTTRNKKEIKQLKNLLQKVILKITPQETRLAIGDLYNLLESDLVELETKV